MAEGEEFDREMADVDWGTVYERQVARGDLSRRCCDLLDIGAGDRILDLGSGPGYLTRKLAERVSSGTVYALDRQRGALRYARAMTTDVNEQIHLVCGDVTNPPVRFADPVPTVAAFLFHHLSEPRQAITGIRRVLPPESRLLVLEYHPDASGEVGPPTKHRLTPAQVRRWLTEDGFERIEEETHSEETYSLVARRTNS